MKFGSLIAVMLAGAAMPAAGQLRDPMAATTDPADRAVMAEAAAAVAGNPPDIGRLDAVLAKLSRPTPLRGMVQTTRAAVLGRSRDPGAAIAAIEDALRLLPDDPRPKMVATGLFTFAGSPQRAADLWMQASSESPDIARMSDNYVMTALIGRLTEMGDRTRADRINARLGEIGFARGAANDRSGSALAVVRRDLAAGDIAGAQRSVAAGPIRPTCSACISIGVTRRCGRESRNGRGRRSRHRRGATSTRCVRTGPPPGISRPQCPMHGGWRRRGGTPR